MIKCYVNHCCKLYASQQSIVSLSTPGLPLGALPLMSQLPTTLCMDCSMTPLIEGCVNSCKLYASQQSIVSLSTPGLPLGAHPLMSQLPTTLCIDCSIKYHCVAKSRVLSSALRRSLHSDLYNRPLLCERGVESDLISACAVYRTINPDCRRMH